MRKLLNDPFACVDEMVGGILVAYPGLVEATPSGRGLVYTGPTSNRKTRIVVGGGSGHEPAFFGYLGPGLADAAAVGNVFASPSAEPAVEAAERLAPADGVLFLYGNYGGDVMRSTIVLGRVAGVEIGLNWSWLVVFGLILWSLSAVQFPDALPGRSRQTYAAMIGRSRPPSS